MDITTCSWFEFQSDMGVPVAVSVGKPREPLFAFEAINDLAPYGLFGREDLTRVEWAARYRARLDSLATRLVDQLDELATKYQGTALVLLCWERLSKPGTWCHRTLAADWLEARLDIDVPELGATYTQLSNKTPGRPAG